MARITVSLTFDVDGMSSWIGTAKSRNPSMLSRGEFTIVGTTRVLDLLKRRDLQATFCVPGHTAYAFPGLIKRIRDEGHEIAHHGWVHENPADFDKDGETEILEKGLEALERVAGVRPIGYRSPAWDLSEDSLKILQDHGFLWDSSCMAGDFIPYYPRTGDEWGPDQPYRFGEVLDLVELPITWALDDFAAFETVTGFFPGFVPPRALETMWQDDFDFAAENCPGGIFIPTMHPECIGRGSRITMLERLIQHMSETADTEFTTMGNYAAAWRELNPIQAWKDQNPLRTGVDSIRETARDSAQPQPSNA